MAAYIEQCIKCTLVLFVLKGNTASDANGVKSSRRTFKAAVYEHAVILPKDLKFPVSRKVALENMMKNLKIYRYQTEEAAKQGADIIVFPEDGIYGMGMTRIALTPYLEYIPDPTRELWCPCNQPERHSNTEIQQYLSCMAKHNSIYLVANFGDRQPCNRNSDPSCPVFGHHQYNTDLVYDKTGTLIAKYHKEHLFYEYQFDKPNSTEFVYFDTPFGRFGVFTCFDILFHDPAIQLIEKYNVTNIVFPTAWMDALPLLAAIEFHSAFAAGVGVNFLAANIHRPEKRFHGSGIYTPNGAVKFYYDDKSEDGKLLVSEINAIEHGNFSQNRWFENASRESKLKCHAKRTASEFNAHVFHDLFTFVKLLPKVRQLRVCQNSLCCHLEYDFADEDNSELFAFGAFDGLHTYQGKYYMQVCTLLKCASTDTKSCGSATKLSSTKFKSIQIHGSFDTKFVFPEILLTDDKSLALVNITDWRYDDGKLSFFNNKLPVLSASLFGRKYEDDPSVF